MFYFLYKLNNNYKVNSNFTLFINSKKIFIK